MKVAGWKEKQNYPCASIGRGSWSHKLHSGFAGLGVCPTCFWYLASVLGDIPVPAGPWGLGWHQSLTLEYLLKVLTWKAPCELKSLLNHWSFSWGQREDIPGPLRAHIGYGGQLISLYLCWVPAFLCLSAFSEEVNSSWVPSYFVFISRGCNGYFTVLCPLPDPSLSWITWGWWGSESLSNDPGLISTSVLFLPNLHL